MKELRPAIIRMHERGVKNNEIVRLLGVHEATVRKAIERFEETGSNNDRKRSGRKKTARTPKNIQRVKKMMQQNPTTKANSTRKLAKKLPFSRRSAQRILKEDLGMKPYKFLERQKLTDVAKKKRKDRSKIMLRRFSQGKHRNIVFSDEKLFDIQQVFSSFLEKVVPF
jgi:transposase